MNEFNDFTIPSGYGEVGVPAFDQTSHLVDPPYNAQPPHAVPMEYSAPSMAQTSHYVQPPFNAQPPHAVKMEYATPGQVSHNVCPPYDAQPPHATTVMGYGEAPFSPADKHPYIGMPYATPQGTYTFRADGTVEAYANGKNTVYAANSRQARTAFQNTLASLGEGGAAGAGAGKGQQAFDLIGGIVDIFKPSGQETPVPAGGQVQQKGVPWGTIAIVGGAVAVVAIGSYFLLRPKAQEA